MMIIGILFILMAVALITTMLCCSKDHLAGFICILVGILVAGAVIMLTDNANTPKAIEVYQGKTTLEVTYRDSIPVDSVVVYKKR